MLTINRLPLKRAPKKLATTTTTNELVDAIASLGQLVIGGTDHHRFAFGERFCFVEQNGSDPNGDPMYDIFSIDDIDKTTKINGDPVVPENYRSPDYTYTAGESGEYQINAGGEVYLFVYNEFPTCP